MEPNSEKLDDLSERIRRAEAGKEAKSVSQPSGSNGRVGFDFVGSVVGSGIVGALLDRAFDTSPWCLLGLVVFGFAAGVMNAWRSMQKSSD